MKSKIITVIPVYNGEKFILRTLESVARQDLPPDRVIVLDNCSTDATESIVRNLGSEHSISSSGQSFPPLKIEYIRNPKNLGLFGNCNRALEFAPETEYLNLLCADDMITPAFYSTLTRALDDCRGLGMAYALDERIDENDQPLSVSGKANGTIESVPVDVFIGRKAEIANQAFSGTLMKTNYQQASCQFRLDMPILGDVAFWADWAKHCQKIVQVNQPLCKYRWHGDNTTNVVMPGMQALILDEWRVMQMNENLRNQKPGPVRRFKLKGLFAVRTGIKAKRIREQNNPVYSQQIVAEGKKISGPLAWFMGQVVVESRDLLVYKLMGRRKHPNNVYS